MTYLLKTALGDGAEAFFPVILDQLAPAQIQRTRKFQVLLRNNDPK